MKKNIKLKHSSYNFIFFVIIIMRQNAEKKINKTVAIIHDCNAMRDQLRSGKSRDEGKL